MSVQQFRLRWNNHQPNFISVFTSMLNNDFLVDVTLAAEGKELYAHKIILSACSVYFQNLFATYPKKHAIVIMTDMKYADLRIIVDFMYCGEVNISEEQLPAILETAKFLKIKGLTEMPDSTVVSKSQKLPSEKTDVLTSGESCWSLDAARQSTSPSRASPSSRRKRSASMEKSIEKQCNDNSIKDTHLKNNIPLNQTQHNIKNQSNEPQFSNFHPMRESLDQYGDIKYIDDIPNNFINRPDDFNMDEPSTAHLQQGHQWNIPEEHIYPRYPALGHQNNVQNNLDSGLESVHGQESKIDLPADMSQCENLMQNPIQHQNILEMDLHSQQASCGNFPNSTLKSPALPKRRRNSNPQSEENFKRALEAVRFGGIGFCKAARMFGVNNRTLWLEYKKKGYPNNRLSIKNRIKREPMSPPLLPQEQQCSEIRKEASLPQEQQCSEEPEEAVLPQQPQLTLLYPPYSVGMMGFFDSRHVGFSSNIQNINRSTFSDESAIIANSPMNLQGVNYNAIQ